MGRKIKPAEFNGLNPFTSCYVLPVIKHWGEDHPIEFVILTTREPTTGRKEFAPNLWADVIGKTENGYLRVTCPAGEFWKAVQEHRILHRDEKTKVVSPYQGPPEGK